MVKLPTFFPSLTSFDFHSRIPCTCYCHPNCCFMFPFPSAFLNTGKEEKNQGKEVTKFLMSRYVIFYLWSHHWNINIVLVIHFILFYRQNFYHFIDVVINPKMRAEEVSSVKFMSGTEGKQFVRIHPDFFYSPGEG